MKHCFILLTLGVLLTGCDKTSQDDTPPEAPEPATMLSGGTDWLAGKDAYEKICAGCHEEGLDGAPKTGDPAAWDKRSWLWEAVLFEHAKTGHEDMPAKGGDETMDEATVTRAAEYMLTLTYPETHRD